MSNKIYAADPGFVNQLISDRADIMEMAKSLGTAEEMRAARADFIAALPTVNITPKNDEELAASYVVDSDGNAHIPIAGELTMKAETDVCGGYTAEALTEYGFISMAAMAADADESVNKIIFDIDSPGGYVDGVASTADVIRTLSKPTEAMVHGGAASAAYWLASQTDHITARSVASRVGSIGVVVEDYDNRKMLEDAGITRRIFTSTDAPDKRLDTAEEEGQVKMIAMLDDIHGLFARAVAEGRGVSLETVNSDFGRGGMLLAEKALAVGMIDQVITTEPRRMAEQLVGPNIGVADENPAAKAEPKEESMDFITLKTEHPEVFAEAAKAGTEDERKRMLALDEELAIDPNNVQLQEVIHEAKANGKTAVEIQGRISKAIRDGSAGENPEDVQTVASPEALSEEDEQAAKIFGMSAEEYRKFTGEAK